MNSSGKSRKSGCLLLVLMCAFPLTSTAGTFRVKWDASSPAPDGLSWETAFTSIQTGIDVAYGAGDSEVWVAAGQYTSSSSPVVTLRPGVELYGGFAGIETERNQRNWNLNVTSIDGQDVHRCILGANDVILDGFTIQHGQATPGGGGMYNETVSPTVTNCTFTQNSASVGGGMYNINRAAPTITDCIFSSNAVGQQGGGIYSTGSSLTLTKCTFTANSASGRGGALLNDLCDPVVVEGCSFTGNSSDQGGAVYNYRCNFSFRNCIVSSNTSDDNGGGIYNDNVQAMEVVDSVFENNWTDEWGGGVLNWGMTNAVIERCTFIGNESDFGGGMGNDGESSLEIADCVFTGNTAIRGGGMNNTGSSPALTRCVFSGNTAEKGGGIYNGDSSAPVITDCTFSENTVTGAGGGMHNEGSSPTVQGCIFDGNVVLDDASPADNTGGGVCNNNASPVIGDCLFTANRSYRGAGIWNGYASPSISSTRFLQNVAGFSGGGMEDLSSGPVLHECILTANTANFGGALSALGASGPVLTNCTLAGNTAETSGGGLYVNAGGEPAFINCTLAGNSAGTSGGCIYNFKAQPIFTNCILWDNDAPTGPVVVNADALVPVITYSCVEGSYVGEGNVDEDPLFVGEIPHGSLQLQAGSPCIDAGTDAGAPDTDLAGRSRPLGVRTDMGAYEGAVEPGDIVTLTLNVQPEGSGNTVPPVGTHSYGRGETVLIRPVETGLHFRGWQGNLIAWEPIQTITLMANMTVTAVFGTKVFYVDGQSTAAMPDGSSWDKAFRDIQPAVDAAYALGDGEVWVAGGVYTGGGVRVVALMDGVEVYGGFGGTETNRGQRNWQANTTVIDGEGTRGCVQGAANAVLDGFTVTHGWTGNGAGILNWEIFLVTIAHCLIIDNNAAEKGGGMFNYNASANVVGCTFHGNTAGHGGGGHV